MKDPSPIGTAMNQSLNYQPDDPSFFSIMVCEPILLLRGITMPSEPKSDDKENADE
jgi:hypothetical protein